MTWRYFIIIPILALFALELFLFVKIIARYRRRFVPLFAMLVIFALNFGLCCALTYLPPSPPVHKIGKAAPAAPTAAPVKTP